MKCHRWMRAFLLPFVLGSVSMVWSAERSQIDEKVFQLRSGGRITLTVDEGSIIVSSWEREEVYLKMIKKAWGENSRDVEQLLDGIEVEIREETNGLVIREMNFRGTENRFHFFDLFDPNFWKEQGRRGSIVDFELTVPEHIHLRLRCDEGNVDVSRVYGELDIDVNEGHVNIGDIISSRILVSVDEGDVNIQEVKDEGRGFLKVETDEGSIWFENGQVSKVDMMTDEGEIVVKSIEADQFWLSTDEGDVEVDFYPMKDGRCRIETAEGNLEISIPENANLQITLQTDDGKIKSDFDLIVKRWDEAESVEEIIGREEGTLKAYTEEGDIRLWKL